MTTAPRYTDMKAVLSHWAGGPDSLRVETVPIPRPGEGEVLIRVRACGLNYPDLLAIEDKYQFKPPLPFSPGIEVAREVMEAGGRSSGIALQRRAAR